MSKITILVIVLVFPILFLLYSCSNNSNGQDNKTKMFISTDIAAGLVGGWRAGLIAVNNFMGAGPSYFDFNKDGLTNQEDQAIVQANLNTDCLGACLRADLNHDNRVNSKDIDILDQSLGPCNIQLAAEMNLCAADLNGDGVINTEDLNIMQATREEFSDEPCPVPGG